MGEVIRTWRSRWTSVWIVWRTPYRLGLERNDRVATLMHNCLEYPEAYYGCARARHDRGAV